MRKEILSVSLIALFIVSTCCAYADTPAIQYAPAEQNNEYQTYQTQYPVPVNNYQTQGYDAGMNNNLQNYNNTNYNVNPQQQLQGNVIFVPANTTFPAVVMNTLDSEVLKAGDSVSLFLGSDFYYGPKLIAGAGSRVNGTVLKSKKGGLGNRNGQLEIKFTNIVTTTGQMLPISARIETEDGSGILKAGTKMDVAASYAKNIGVGTASGAVLGTAMGALSSGSVGKGAIYGTALGGGLALAKSLAERGNSVQIPQNAQINLVLDQPLTVSSNTTF